MRGHLKSIGWSSIEYLFYPVLMIAAAPLMVGAVGGEGLGLVMLVNAVAGMGGAANLGMGAATIRFVSARLGNHDQQGAISVARTTLTLGLGASMVVAGVIAAGAPWMAQSVFSKMGDQQSVAFALCCAALMLVLSQVDGVLSATLKGAERFDLSAKWEMAGKLTMVCGSLTAAMTTHRVADVLVVLLVVQGVFVVIKSMIAGRPLGCAVLLPGFGDRSLLREILGFGAWSWLQGVAGMLFGHADRLLVGALLGASALSYYSIAAQLAQQIHTVPAAAMSFLFPLVSRRVEQTGQAGLQRITQWGLGLNLALSLSLGGFLFAFGADVLALWMGTSFASQSTDILPWLILAFFLLSLNVAPYYLLMGRNQVRFLSLTNVAGSTAGLLAAWLLMPVLGLLGAALGRVALGITMLLTYRRLFALKTSS